MNGSDLIKFDSPPFQNNRESISTSPGSNPFDILSQRAENTSLTGNTDVQIISDDDFKITTDFLNFGKEALVFDLSGRESLGILNLESLNCNLVKDDLSTSNSEQLNTAFLHPFSCSNRRFSYLSSTSSVSVTPSFFLNLGSLEASELWKTSVSPIDKCDSSVSQDFLNNGFILTNSINVLSESKNVFNFELDNVRSEKQRKSFKSGNFEKSILNCLPEQKEAEDDGFNDSVFFEARHIASKIEDGGAEFTSIEEDLLDSTSPPEFVEINEDEENQDPVDVKDKVFSKIDKFVPAPLVNALNNMSNPVESKNVVDAAPIDDNNSTDKNTIEIKQNISNIFKNKLENGSSNYSFGRGSSCSSSKDAKEILQNLSEIINNECKDPRQNWEGQQLIANLAGIICSDTQFNETPEQSVENCEPLDLTTKSVRSNDERVTNLSIKNLMRESAPKGLSQSFSFSAPLAPSKLLANIKTKKISSTGSLDCERDRNGCEFSKLKPRKIDEKSFDKKKGPLKAIIPVGNMSKSKDITLSRQSLNTEVSTPPKKEELQSNLTKFKRTTSTPILSQLKPIAQSTPDNTKNLNGSPSGISLLRRPSFCSPVSPLAKPNTPKVPSTNKLNSKPSPKNSSRQTLSEVQNSMYRRHSTTELKSNGNSLPKLKRNSSIGKSFKISSEINKAKENLSPLKSLFKKVTNVHKNHLLQDKTMKSIKSVRF